ncbi:MFS transporter [soil metagenome]
MGSPGPSEAQRQRSLNLLLVNTFIMYAGFFMIIPILAVHYVDGLGWSGLWIGAVLALRQLTQQGMAPLSGYLSDRYGAKGLICAGMFIRGCGFTLIAFSHSPAMLFAAMLLSGIGGGLFDAPEAAMVATLLDESSRRRYYALVATVSALGGAVGTQLGVLLLDIDFGLVALLSASCYFLIGVVSLLTLPRVVTGELLQCERNGISRAVRDRPFVLFSGILLGFWFVSSQFSITLPLRAADIAGDGVLGLLFGLNTAITIVFSYPLLRFTEKRFSPRQSVIVGLLVNGVAYVGLAFARNRIDLLGCVGLIAIGMLIARPGLQSLTVDLSDQRAIGSYLGVNALSLGIGGAIGSIGGGLLYDLGDRFDLAALPWLVFGGISTLTAFGLARFATDRRFITENDPSTIPEQALRV